MAIRTSGVDKVDLANFESFMAYGTTDGGTTWVGQTVDAQGHLQVDVLSGGGGGTLKTDGSAIDAADTGGIVAGKDSSDNAQFIATDTDGKLTVKNEDLRTVLGTTDLTCDNALSVGGGKKTIQACEDHNDWAAQGDASNLATSTTHVQGTNSVSFDKSGTSSTIGYIDDTITAVDLSCYQTHAICHYAMYISSTTNVTNLFLRLGTDSSNYFQYDFTNLAAGWNGFDARLTAPTSQTGAGANLASVTYVAAGITMANTGSTLSGILVDNITAKRMLEVVSFGAESVDLATRVRLQDGNTGVLADIEADSTKKAIFVQSESLMPSSGGTLGLEAGALKVGDVGLLGNTAADGSGTDYHALIDTSGHIQIDVVSAPTTAVTGTFWQATQPVSIAQDIMLGTDFSNVFGAASIVSATPALKVEEQGTITVDCNSSDVTIDNTSIAVTGTFWQATQPVSGTVTANLSSTDNTVLDNIDSNTDYGAVVGGGAEATALRVTIANDSTGVVSIDDNGGSITVDGSLTVDLGSNNDVTLPAATTGGATAYKLISAASTNATNVKASAGQIYMITASNINAAVRYLKIYNKASAPTVGTDTPAFTFAIPGDTTGAGTNIPIPACGIALGTGIAFAFTTGVADSDTGAVAANEIVVNMAYK